MARISHFDSGLPRSGQTWARRLAPPAFPKRSACRSGSPHCSRDAPAQAEILNHRPSRRSPLRVDAVEKSRKSIDTENLAKVVFSTLLQQGTLEPIRRPVVVFFYESMWGRSGRRARSASAVFKIFVLHPKKTFSTASVKRRHQTANVRSPLLPRYQTSIGILIVPILAITRQHPSRIAGRDRSQQLL
jgi:hypothetical protein